MKIPSSVSKLLKHVWKPENGFSHFESTIKINPDSIPYPGYFQYRPETKPHEVQAFSGKEAIELVKAGVFGSHAFINDSGNAVVNEHCVHALSDCLSEMYDAWRKYEQRIDKIERTCPYPYRTPEGKRLA